MGAAPGEHQDFKFDPEEVDQGLAISLAFSDPWVDYLESGGTIDLDRALRPQTVACAPLADSQKVFLDP